MTGIELHTVTVTRGADRVIDRLSLRIGAGERFALLGPSGCGKTTILRSVAGLDRVADGRVLLGTTDVTDRRPRDRNLTLIDQQASLQPHLDVERNLAFALQLRKVPRAQIDERVGALSRTFSLRSLLPRRPRALSSGERHEVTLARSLLRRSDALLMDEPFSRIDPVRRDILLRELIQIQQGYGITLLITTNDQRVAMGLAHRIGIIDRGRLVQVGTPDEIYRRPASVLAAEAIGSPPMNLIDGVIARVDGQVHVRAGPLSIPTWAIALTGRVGEPVIVGIRPQDVELDTDPRGTAPRLCVLRGEFLGAQVAVHLASSSGARLTAMTPHPGPEIDGRVSVTIRPADVHLFDIVDGTSIAHGI